MENAQFIAQVLNFIQASIRFVMNRGIARERIQAVLDEAEQQGTDISPDVVQAELDSLTAEIDETEALLDNGG